jgi:hypothetical protein
LGADTDYVGAVSVQPPIPLAAFEGSWNTEDGRFDLLVYAPQGIPVVLGVLAGEDALGKSCWVLEPLEEFIRICRGHDPGARFHSALRYADIGCFGRVVVTDDGGIDWDEDEEPNAPADSQPGAVHYAIGEAVNDGWPEDFVLAAELYATAVVTGSIPAEEDRVAVARGLLAVQPGAADLDEEDLTVGVESIRALAHGHVVDLAIPDPADDLRWPCPWRIYSDALPPGCTIASLRVEFGGDVRAAAAAFLARAIRSS